MIDYSILYVYPQFHQVSFTIIAQKHIEYLRKLNKVKIYEMDELMFPSFTPVSRYKAVLHPSIYVMNRVLKSKTDYYGILKEEYFIEWRKRYEELIGVDVCDSDRMSEYAVSILNRVDKVIVPSNFCKEVFEKSGVKAKVFRIPHGLDPYWYETPNVWETKPTSSINPAILELFLHKTRRKAKILLFWLWHCYDENTRVLTREGFKYFWELKPDDEIATFNMETGELEYQKPEKIWVYDYDGEMIHFEGQHYDLLVTPNHRMVVRDSYEYVKHSLGKSKRSMAKKDVVDSVRPWRFINAEDLYNYFTTHKSRKRFEIPRAVKWKGKTIEFFEMPKMELDKNYPVWVLNSVNNRPREVERVPIRPLLRFLGWWIAEGTARYHEHNQEYVIMISNKRPEYISEIVETIKEMGFHPVVNKYPEYARDKKLDDYIYKVAVVSKQLYMLLKNLGLPVHPDVKGKRAKLKFVPQFIKELSPDLIIEFLKALWKGDGTFTKDAGFLKYATTSKRLAEDVAELLLKCGYAVAISEDKKRGLYNVCPSKKYVTPTIIKPPIKVYYRGKVWGVTVPNGVIIVERNGKIAISGNSPERKGWSEVMKTYRAVRSRRKDVVLVLKTVAPNPTEFLQVIDLGAVNVYGWLDEANKIALYDLADITLMFSRGGAWEMNCLESLGRGIPCLASNWGSWTDYVPDFLRVKTGRRVQPLPKNVIHVGHGYAVDVEDAVSKVLDILDNYEEYRAKTVEWREKMLKNEFRWDLIAGKIVDVVSSG